MLFSEETYRQGKQRILDEIKSTRSLLRHYNRSIKTIPAFRKEAYEGIEVLTEEITRLMGELKKLEKWRKKHNYPEDKPYVPFYIEEERAGWSEADWEAYRDWVMDMDAIEADLIHKMEGEDYGEK